MDLKSFLYLLGGIGLFLYGMNVLSSSLEKMAGVRLEKILEKLTNNRLKGVGLGAAVTAIIQSSAATSVMVIGFVNAGIMKLMQAIPVVMGANIGTTITAQILRLGDVSGENIILQLIKPSSFAPICILLGAALLLISKRSRTKDIASIIIGLGVLFFGMTTMETALSPLRDSQTFVDLFYIFRHPMLGLLLGLAVTAILQSSSAAVGILQAMSSTGTVTFSMAVPIIIGMNIGKCITVIIASIGTSKKAKRVVLIDVINNVIGAVCFMVFIYGFQSLIGFSMWDDVVNRGGIANFHTIFNVVTTVVLLPFCTGLINLSGKIIKDDDENKIEKEISLLNDMILKTPSVALQQCKKVIFTMLDAIQENYHIALGLMEKYDDKQAAALESNERFLDRSETVLGDYLIKITGKNISESDSRLATEIMHTVGDFERIGDYCVNLKEVAEYNLDQGLEFSAVCKKELEQMKSAVTHIINLTQEAYVNDDVVVAQRVEPLEDTIDMLEEMLKESHVERLKVGACSTQAGISFVEVVTNLEKIADHCSNVAVHITQRLTNNPSLDTHSHRQMLRQGPSEEFKALYRYYDDLYCSPIREMSKVENL